MKFTIELVTPEKAAEYLARNPHNRKISKSIVSDYATQMKSGQWEGETGETIKIAKEDGTLLDGQQRLSAVVLSGKPQQFAFAWDVPKRAFTKIDTGKKRTSGDVLYIEGVKNAYQLSGIIRTYLNLKRGGAYSSRGFVFASGIHNQDILREYMKHSQYWDETNRVTSHWYVDFQRIIPPSMIGGFYATFWDHNLDKAMTFFDKLCTGTHIMSEDDPVAIFRNILIADATARYKMPNYDKGALMIKAWNFSFQNKKITKRELSFDHKLEEYPTILG